MDRHSNLTSATRASPSVRDLLKVQADIRPGAPAIVAPGCGSLTYHALSQQVDSVIEALRRMAIGRHDRVAVVLPNGPEMAVAFVAVAAGAACAPLNPAYTASEFDFYLADLRAVALIVPEGVASPARSVAARRGMRILELRPYLQVGAGAFTLKGDRIATPADGGFPQQDDIALLLHTSGTTSRPKLVPLTQQNICASAYHIARTLTLTEHDRCLNVMPLFHIHGLIAGLLASLLSGGVVVCPAGCVPTDLASWIKEFQPTWYTAVPTIHQTVLAMARQGLISTSDSLLRLIRSSSAPLPFQLMAELEGVFSVPVIEAYGMTEGAHQIASNPLPPATRKPGTVGIATGSEIAIVGEGGEFLARGNTGEIVIRGPNVIGGYENNPVINGVAFRNGWFRTGDQGFLDEDGYLTITGRLKEIINRGGEKVSPREVDDVLMDHPAVLQAVTFAIPHPTLGEDVAAAVVLRDGSDTTEREIRNYAVARLVPFKVPRRVMILDELPRGPTGKLQRIGLAEKLSLAQGDSGAFVAPRDETEGVLARMWQEILRLDTPIGARDDFFDIGGNSLQAARLFADIEITFHAKLPLSILWESATLESLATAIRQHPTSPPTSSLVVLHPEGTSPPLFWVHEAGGEIYTMRNLSNHLGPDQPLYGFQARGIDGKQVPHSRIEDMAAYYIQLMRSVQAEGPYFLGGHSLGGVVAYEMAQQLSAHGQDARLLALIDTPAPRRSLWKKLRYHFGYALKRGPRIGIAYIVDQAALAGRRVHWKLRERMMRKGSRASLSPRPSETLATAFSVARNRYVERAYGGAVALFVTAGAHAPDLDWGRLITGKLEIHAIPGGHGESLSEPNVQVVAAKLRECLGRAQVAA